MEDIYLSKAQEIGRDYAAQIKSLDADGKFTRMLADNTFIDNEYGKIYEVEKTSGYNRLKIGADKNQTDLLLRLCENIAPPYFILYVLVVSRQGHEQGRYQSPLIETINEVQSFLSEYKTFFETDGRHHIWLGTPDNSGLMIYDQHNVIYCYGELEKQISYLQKAGFQEKAFDFPAPHAHRYNEKNDKFEEQILQHWDWEVFPLTDDDTYQS